MNCDGVRVLLSAYVDGELSSGELLRAEQHLRRCHSCADEVDSLRQTIALVASMDEVAIPATFHAQLHNRLVALGPPVPAVRGILAAPGWQRNLGRWAVPAAAAAAALAVGLTSLPHAKEQAGLEGRQSMFSVAPAQHVVDSTPTPGNPLPPVPPAQAAQAALPAPPVSSGKPPESEPTPPIIDAPVHPGGTTTPAPNVTPPPDAIQPPVAPPEKTAVNPPEITPALPKGDNVTTPGNGVAVTVPPAGSEQPAEPLTPKNTISSDATVTTANAENVTKALAAFHPNLEGDTIYVKLPADQRKAVEDAVKNASGVQVVSGFAVVQTDLAGEIHKREVNIAAYQQQAEHLERQIPQLKGQDREDALAQHKMLTDGIKQESETLQLVNSQVDMAIITVHLKVQGR